MKTYIAFLVAFLLASCAVMQPPTAVNIKPMLANELLEKPFGHSESIKDFKNNMPSGTKVQKLIRRNPRPNHRPDTIYNFMYKKSKWSVYKTQFNQEFVLGGVIRNPKVELANGIQIGMTKSKFIESIMDLTSDERDTVVIKHPKTNRTFNFYFDKNSRLQRFTFTGNNP